MLMTGLLASVVLLFDEFVKVAFVGCSVSPSPTAGDTSSCSSSGTSTVW